MPLDLLGLLAPPACVACRRPPSRGDVLCRDCRLALPWLGPATCRRCGLPAPCGTRCPASRAAFERAWAPVAYDGPARALVRALKERGAMVVARVMAAQIAALAPPGLLEGAVIVPVPSDPLRRRLRGIDHAGRLAGELASRCGLEATAVLCRRPTITSARQAGATRAQRMTEGRLPVAARVGEGPSVVVLVDDVHTTGATLDVCARALRSVGTHEIRVVTYARTLP